jgi:hypothetical protein
MIPNHILDALTPETCVAILSRGGEIHFLVHQATDDPAAVRALAAREGSEALATHMQDHAEIQQLVASRERDVGGEG